MLIILFLENTVFIIQSSFIAQNLSIFSTLAYFNSTKLNPYFHPHPTLALKSPITSLGGYKMPDHRLQVIKEQLLIIISTGAQSVGA